MSLPSKQSQSKTSTDNADVTTPNDLALCLALLDQTEPDLAAIILAWPGLSRQQCQHIPLPTPSRSSNMSPPPERRLESFFPKLPFFALSSKISFLGTA